MARTKQTMRKVGIGPGVASKAASKPSGKKAASEARGKQKLKSRLNYQIKSLREIKKAQKTTNLLIPRAPFMRLVRQISDMLCSQMNSEVFEYVRWQFTGLACLQEAAEDFLIEFMNDSYIACAHAHRVTLMNKDFSVVSRLRYRFDKFLQPIPMTDKKAFDILNIPPARPVKQKVPVEDVTHLYKTRKITEKVHEQLKEQERLHFSEDQILKEEVLRLGALNSNAMANVPGQMVVNVSATQNEDYLTITPEDKEMLEKKNVEISDSVLFCSLRLVFFAYHGLIFMVVLEQFYIFFLISMFSYRAIITSLPPEISSNLFVLDPLVSVNLLKDTDSKLEHFMRDFDFLACNIIILPYVERFAFFLTLMVSFFFTYFFNICLSIWYCFVVDIGA